MEPKRAGQEGPRSHVTCINMERKDQHRRVSVVGTDVVIAASVRALFVFLWPKILVRGDTRRGIFVQEHGTCDTKAGAWWVRCTHGL